MNEKVKINQLPAPTFRWLHMNEAEVEAIGEEKRAAVQHFEKSGQDSEPLRIEVAFDGEERIVPVVVDVAENADADVIMNFVSGEDGENPVAGARSGEESDPVPSRVLVPSRVQAQLSLHIGKNASVRLVQVQRLSQETELRSFVNTMLEEGASLTLIQVVLSGGRTYIECKSTLAGDRSALHIEMAYSLHGEESLDINYIADHLGEKTTSEMNAYGVLSDRSRKLFRGTIDFKKGCAGAVGSELEDVLLLDDEIVNQTIPLILCAEEDVQGSHGATLGRLPEDVLFYMRSRGMSLEHIYAMMARARIERVASRIMDETTRKLVADYLGDKDPIETDKK